MVKILLDRKGANPDMADTKGGRTPLSWAAGSGYEGTVRMLLERKDVNPDRPDTKYGRTPLSWAAGSGHEGIVKILLEREDVNPNLEIAENVWMPLSWKVGNGCVEIVRVTKEKDNLEYPDRGAEGEDSDWGDGQYPCQSDSEDPDSEVSEAVATPPQSSLPEGHDGVARIQVDPDNANSDHVDHGG